MTLTILKIIEENINNTLQEEVMVKALNHLVCARKEKQMPNEIVMIYCDWWSVFIQEVVMVNSTESFGE